LVFFIAVLNVESLQFFGNSLPVRLGICFDKAVDIGAERGLLPLVLTNVTMLFAICSLRRFTASPHRQPVLKHIFVMTCASLLCALLSVSSRFMTCSGYKKPFQTAYVLAF